MEYLRRAHQAPSRCRLGSHIRRALQWINVDHPTYQWPVETPPGTTLKFDFVGEYEYLKCLWCQSEAMVATLNVFEQTRADSAADYFAMAYGIVKREVLAKGPRLPCRLHALCRPANDVSASQRPPGQLPPIRQFILNIMTLDRMIQNQTGASLAS